MTTPLSPTGLLTINNTNFVKNWTQINQFNQNLLDGILGTQKLQTYSPTFEPVDGSSINIGSTGSVEGYWYQYFGIVYMWGRVFWSGTGIDPGSGTNHYTFSLPVTPHPILNDLIIGAEGQSAGHSPTIGAGCLRDASNIAGNSQNFILNLIQSNRVWFLIESGHSTRTMTSSQPITWADGDVIILWASYRGII